MKNKINNITKMGMLQGLTALAAGSAVVRPASHPDAVFGLTWLLLQTVRELFFVTFLQQPRRTHCKSKQQIEKTTKTRKAIMKTANRIISADFGAGALKSYFTLASAAALVVMATSQAPAQLLNPGIFPPRSSLYGQTYGQWAAAWEIWTFSTPFSICPAADTTGQFAYVNQDLSSPVFFLAPDFGGTVVRTVTVPPNKALFFPLVFAAVFYFPGPLQIPNQIQPYNASVNSAVLAGVAVPFGAAVGNARGWNANLVAKATALACEVDGVPVASLFSYREQSPVFSFVLPVDNAFGDPALSGLTSYPTVDAGIYLMLAPLSAGQHTIHFHAEETSPVTFVEDVTYNLTVQ